MLFALCSLTVTHIRLSRLTVGSIHAPVSQIWGCSSRIQSQEHSLAASRPVLFQPSACQELTLENPRVLQLTYLTMDRLSPQPTGFGGHYAAVSHGDTIFKVFGSVWTDFN